MCGIAGALAQTERPVPYDAGVRMNRSMVHRGPDEQGLHWEARVMLGCRRLSIIDARHGQQPIKNEHETVRAVMNGEIYNFRDLRRKLLELGHVFRTRCDTEVVVHLYEERGPAFVEELRGMFAIALFDGRSGTLLLARDRLGKKPLYYALTNNFLVFASEIKAIHASGLVPKTLEVTSLAAYLSYGFVPGKHTMFSGIHKLPAATLLLADRRELKFSRYWDVPAQVIQPRNSCELPAKLLELLEDAVSARLVTEAPLGAFLSGGIDSTAVVGLMTRRLREPVQTFSIGFEEAKVDEAGYARIVAAHFGTTHHEMLMTGCSPELLEEVNWHRDEPAADPADVPTFMLAKFARQYVTVVLTGEGGDETFGGYNRYLKYTQILKAERVFPGLARAASWLGNSTDLLNGRLNRRLAKALWIVGLPRRERPRGWIAILTDAEKRRLLKRRVWSAVVEENASHELLEACTRRSSGLPPIARCMYMDLKVQLAEQLLMKVDKMTMAASVEARCPLLDHRLVEFAAQLPLRYKIHNGVSKVLLRKAVAPLIPRVILTRAKQGFEVPLRTWLTRDLASLTEALLLSQTGPLTAYIDAGRVHTMWQDLRDRDDQLLGRQIWLLLNLAVWVRQHWH